MDLTRLPPHGAAFVPPTREEPVADFFRLSKRTKSRGTCKALMKVHAAVSVTEIHSIKRLLKRRIKTQTRTWERSSIPSLAGLWVRSVLAA